jgi:hypothetical protein
MRFKLSLLLLFGLVYSGKTCFAQNPDSIFRIKAKVCNESNIPLFYTHIINIRNGRGTISDTSGIFIINAQKKDSILFRNLAYQDLVITAFELLTENTIHMKIRLYAIKEVKIFEWGSTYEDFRAKMMSLPVSENWGEKLGLPQQKGNPISDYKNADVISNPFFAITNPVDFLYFNLNKKQQSIRKVIEFQKNEDLIRRFESVYNKSRIAEITKLTGKDLDNFLIYLNIHFQCDFYCNEIQIVNEIYKHWKIYKDAENK